MLTTNSCAKWWRSWAQVEVGRGCACVSCVSHVIVVIVVVVGPHSDRLADEKKWYPSMQLWI